ncbi:MAG: amino acid permease [Gammaproteobacteria bacterium]|nr:amino acid permease [Gammaproteobacteria bacterium]
MTEHVQLKRSISLPLVTFYGLGTIIGAGIYVLVGEIAGEAGMYAPLAFFISALIAMFSGFSYAELSARYPHSAGEAAYVNAAFGIRILSTLVGWSVVLTGLVSAAALISGFVGYFQFFLDLPAWAVITLLVFVLGGIAIWGITESMWLATVVTLLEIGGLFFILFAVGDVLTELPARWREVTPPMHGDAWLGIFVGAFIAFYAFVGFEDIVNVAEEVKNPERNLPLAIIIALVVSTIFYVLISLVAVLAMPVEALSQSRAPFADMLAQRSVASATVISMISLIAILNGALVQIIMASRVVYGMSRQGMAPAVLGRVNTFTRTPIIATLLVCLVVLVLASWLPLSTLAQITSFIILLVFAAMHLALWNVKKRRPEPAGVFCYPIFIPVAGFFIVLAVLSFRIWIVFG